MRHISLRLVQDINRRPVCPGDSARCREPFKCFFFCVYILAEEKWRIHCGIRILMGPVAQEELAHEEKATGINKISFWESWKHVSSNRLKWTVLDFAGTHSEYSQRHRLLIFCAFNGVDPHRYQNICKGLRVFCVGWNLYFLLLWLFGLFVAVVHFFLSQRVTLFH